MQIIKKLTLYCLFVLFFPIYVNAESWDGVVSSDLYYYGIGTGATETEASERALASLIESIAIHVSSDFVGLTENEVKGDDVHTHSCVQSCIQTYAQSSLTNVGKMTRGKEPEMQVLRYMLRTELTRIYDGRIAKAKDMVVLAEEALQAIRLDMALEYYYWAYSLIRSVQHPNEVRDDEGHVLMNWLPVRIRQLLSNIDVQYGGNDDERVNLLFSYEGKPVSCLEFTYSDGRTDCEGRASGGRSMIEMVQGYKTDVYHLNIEYEYKGQARGDAEMESVLNVVPRRVFIEAEKTVIASVVPVTRQFPSTSNKPYASQLVSDASAQAEVVGKVIDAIRQHRYSDVNRLFTLEGLSMYRDLISYGSAHIVGKPHIQFYKSANGHTVARGLQMSFTFRRGTKKTFVEDVVFTLDKDNRISNVAFGLGEVAENDILCKYAPGWKDETREVIMEFMESYKTAYCLKRLDYIRDIFADDAVIIIGNVVRRQTSQANDHNRRAISTEGQERIRYNRYTKDEYLKNLERCFLRNEFINLRFSQNEVQWLEKYQDKELFAIQIGQEYNSTTYADKGYLFLLVDMTDHDAPQIKIRTWQPNEVSMDKLYNAGDFYNE